MKGCSRASRTGNLRPDDELSEGQFIKVAERLYDRYDVWTRADWAQVMYAGLLP